MRPTKFHMGLDSEAAEAVQQVRRTMTNRAIVIGDFDAELKQMSVFFDRLIQ